MGVVCQSSSCRNICTLVVLRGEWIVYKYDFFDDVFVQCPKCKNKYKVIGSVYDGPEEGYVKHFLN